MAATHLRLVSDQDYLNSHTHNSNPPITVRLDHVLPLLLDASAHNRQWLKDFADETLEISADLYDILLAYQRTRKAA
jgi:hypothetical protein